MPGHARELTFSTQHRLPLLLDAERAAWVIGAIDRARSIHRFRVLAYVVMPEHVHLLVLPCAERPEIAPVLKSIKQGVARRAVRRLKMDRPDLLGELRVGRPGGRVEHRFWMQGSGYDRNLTSAASVRAAVEYIHANQVRRGLVERVTDWRWSSAGWYAGMTDQPIEIDPIG
ncbi:MAG: hypothetical protein DHS20C14_07680 [Phycisphaeraceae bacterium]|nr:MAG: hypothetical protein DHS20C14_07680 [Phycisphaeraceae bacterium]